MASLLPGHSSGGSRSKGRSRLSSSAVAADSPYAADIQGSLTSRSDRQEARRRLLRSGKGFVDVSLLDDEEEECSDPDTQLQPPPDSCTRRVTFSAAGGTEQQLVQQQQADQPSPVLLQAARLWRGAAASVCAGQRLQSLEHHAAELKQRQEIHTELKAWVEQVLSQPQEELLDPALEDSSSNIGQAVFSDDGQQQHHHHRHHHHHPHSLQPGLEHADGAAGAQDAAACGGEHHRRRKSSHRHKRHSHKHHQQAAVEGLEGVTQQGADSDAAAAVARQAGAGGVPTVGPEAGQQNAVSEPVQQDGEQWHQFNAAEQQLIAQMQQDQQQLMEQLQQAYQQIAALTAAQAAAEAAAAAAAAAATAAAATAAAAPAGVQHQQAPQQQQQADVVLHPAPDTQVLVITRNSNDSQGDQNQHTPSLRHSGDMQDMEEQQDPRAVQPTAPATARRSSISSSPRARRTSTAAAGAQPGNSPRTPRAAGKVPKGPAAAGSNSKSAEDAATLATPRKSLQAAAAAKAKESASLPVPQGRGLTLPQQQALVQRLQQAEEVMDLLQQDLQESLQAQQLLQEQLQQLQEQLQQLQGTGCAEGCSEGSAATGQVSGPQKEQPRSEQEQQQQGQVAGGSEPTAVGAEGPAVAQQEVQASGVSGAQPSEQAGDGVAAEVLALQQQLQEQVQLSSSAQQEVARAQEVTAAQQQQIGELQQQLQQQQELEQKQGQYIQQIEALQVQLDGLNSQLQVLQQQQQKQELWATNQADQSSLQYQQQVHNMSPQELQDVLLQQQLGAAAAAAADGCVCCQHEARCQQLQSILQALLQQLQAQEAQQHTSCTMRPYTAATQGSPRARATWQHRPVELHTWLYPPLQVSRPGTQQSAHTGSQLLQPAAAQSCHRSVSAPRCATASSPRQANWDRVSNRPASPGPRCNTSGTLTARYGGSAAAACQDSVLQSLEYRLRPLTYRGPDRAAADAIAAATGGRRRLSADAEKGLLASLHVAPVSARGKGPVQAMHNIVPAAATVADRQFSCDEGASVDAVGRVAAGEGGCAVVCLTCRRSGGMCSPGRQRRAGVAGPGVQGSSSPRSGRGGQSFQQGVARRGVPRLVLGGLH